MMNSTKKTTSSLKHTDVDVVERGKKARRGKLRCAIDENLEFNMSRMETYFFAQWNSVLYDALVVAAAIEFCDMTIRRPAQGWARSFSLRIPVHEPDRWSQNSIVDRLCEALEFLTGDHWDLNFYPRELPAVTPRQNKLELQCEVSAVMPFSDGLDSSAAAALAAHELGRRFVRVRLGTKKFIPNGIDLIKEPFAAVPYRVRQGKNRFGESSARSRGFKFALISGMAAFLSGAERIIVPESGQGALGPSLIPVGQAWPDYRSHPRFGKMIENLLHSLFGFRGRFEYFYVWNTKGETFAQALGLPDNNLNWKNTRSCWQQNRQIGVNGKARQCGICAACMLRRLSVFAAGQEEPACTYIWENLRATTFEAGASTNFDKTKITGAMRQYAIAGTLYLEHLATLGDLQANVPRVNAESYWISRSLGLPKDLTTKKLNQLLARHKIEWENFKVSLGPDAFIKNWVHEAS